MHLPDFFPFTRPRAEETFLIFDIANGSVGGAIATMTGKEVRLLYTTRNDVAYAEHTADAIVRTLTKSVSETATELSNALSRFPHVRASHIELTFHAPWVRTYSTHYTIPLPHETEITKKLLKKVSSRIQTELTPDVIRIHQQISHIELNGYRTADPYGKRATNIALTITESTTRSYVHESVISTISRVFPHFPIHMNSFVAQALTYLPFFNTHEQSTFIDVGNIYTTFTIIKNGLVHETGAAQFGTYTILNAIAKAFAVETTQAQALLNTYIDQTCTPSHCKKVEDALRELEPQWTKSCGDTLSILTAQSGKFPAPVCLFARAPYVPLYTDMVQKLDFAQFIMTTRPFKVFPLTLQDAHENVRFDSGVTPDAALALTARYYRK